MTRSAISILGAALLALSTSALACEADTPCDKCAKESEMSWNPDNKYVSERLNHFYALDNLIKSAYEANDLSTSAKLAHEYLNLASTYRCNWNYGNAIHDANRYLGLISLKKRRPSCGESLSTEIWKKQRIPAVEQLWARSGAGRRPPAGRAR